MASVPHGSTERLLARLRELEAPPPQPKGRIDVSLQNGTVLVGSDPHWWPGQRTAAQEWFILFAAHFRPDLIIMNGDAFDGAGISRFPPMNWDSVPSVADQLEATRENLRDIELASPRSRRVWTLGNHDARFEKLLATRVPEYKDVVGVSLKDHFGAAWEPCWSVDINRTCIVKHRFRGGIHAVYNNVLKSGRSIVTGHLHSLQVRPITDYDGTRYGCDCGFLSDARLPQFEYLEDNPADWRSGFLLLTFKDGRLLWPEIIHVLPDGRAEFRGKVGLDLAGLGMARQGKVQKPQVCHVEDGR